jgi:sulfur transfer protein SufE/stress-induced morphogen
MQRYKQLLFFAAKLDVLPAELHTDANKVKGCVSQVWVAAELRDDGKLYWRADSDSQLTKGLAALLVQGLSGCTPAEVAAVRPGFVEALGLAQSLTPSRSNGFLNMLKLMQARALEAMVAQARALDSAGGDVGAADAADEEVEAAAVAPDAASAAAAGAPSGTPVADAMRAKLSAALAPARLVLTDDSRRHAGHGGYKGNANYSGETHFTVEVASAQFEGLSSLKRHRLVYGLLAAEMGEGPVHALSLVTQTPAEAGLD